MKLRDEHLQLLIPLQQPHGRPPGQAADVSKSTPIPLTERLFQQAPGKLFQFLVFHVAADQPIFQQLAEGKQPPVHGKGRQHGVKPDIDFILPPQQPHFLKGVLPAIFQQVEVAAAALYGVTRLQVLGREAVEVAVFTELVLKQQRIPSQRKEQLAVLAHQIQKMLLPMLYRISEDGELMASDGAEVQMEPAGVQGVEIAQVIPQDLLPLFFVQRRCA